MLVETDSAAPTQCTNRHGTPFQCAAGDSCCGDVCVARGDVCCVNVEGNSFPCQGNGGQCCGNACAAPGSKCCRSPFVAKSMWYPVTQATTCAFSFLASDGATPYQKQVKAPVALLESDDAAPTQCTNRHGTPFQCAANDRCCGDVCVAQGDVCCVNVEGNFFPCQGKGGQFCGNACAAPGSKCCRSPLVERSRWYPVSKETKCSFSLLEEDDASPEQLEDDRDAVPEEGGAMLVEIDSAAPTQCTNRHGTPFQCAAGDSCCGDVCVARGDVCCVNVEGYSFPCQGNGGQCCGNACAAPGSKCCRSPYVARSMWYPVSQATTCSFSFLASDGATPYQKQVKAPVALLESDDAAPTQCTNRHSLPEASQGP